MSYIDEMQSRVSEAQKRLDMVRVSAERHKSDLEGWSRKYDTLKAENLQLREMLQTLLGVIEDGSVVLGQNSDAKVLTLEDEVPAEGEDAIASELDDDLRADREDKTQARAADFADELRESLSGFEGLAKKDTPGAEPMAAPAEKQSTPKNSEIDETRKFLNSLRRKKG